MTPTPSILTLDLAKAVGWACLKGDQSLTSGHRSFAPLPGQKVGALFYKWAAWLDIRTKTHGIKFVAYELVDFRMQNRHWVQMYHGMTAILMAKCEAHGIEYRGYTVADIKHAATGKKKASKPDMIRAARAQWPDQHVIDDNQADALWVLWLAMKDCGIDLKHEEELF